MFREVRGTDFSSRSRRRWKLSVRTSSRTSAELGDTGRPAPRNLAFRALHEVRAGLRCVYARFLKGHDIRAPSCKGVTYEGSPTQGRFI